VTEFAIRTHDLTKVFGNVMAVNGLNLEVPSGSLFGLLGPNGAGKTTTFSMICGFLRPTAGDAEVLGEPIGRIDRLTGRIAALPQDARFHPERRVRDVMVYLARLGGLSGPAAKKEVGRVLETVGMTSASTLKGKALSHGMAKRLGVAQAFIGHPELVLLDEPTEGLDPRAAHTVRSMIKALAGTRTTVLISSHNLAEIQDICDHVAIIDHGKLVKSGPISEITQANEVLILSIGSDSKDPTGALQRMEQVKKVTRDGLKVRVEFRPRPGQSVEDAISEILKTAIDNGVLISAVDRGRSLEESYLELT